MLKKNKYKRLKESMIEEILMKNGIDDERILRAFWDIERHHFVSEAFEAKSYADAAIPILKSQTISQPFMVAKMTQELDLQGNESVLEIGTGSGFQAAILAYLGVQVYSIERHFELAEQARLRFKLYGLNVQTMVGDGTLGWPSKGPFDRIIATAGSPHVPQSLADQLAEGGIMLIPMGDLKQQKLVKLRRKGGELLQENLVDCSFVPLIGKEGWEGT
jgi:protein-L-isoaspartate(D-aspartate) O-methyltransferase